MIPLSLYIHTPWCLRKCPYCDFNSHKSPEKLPEEDYITALIADLAIDKKAVVQTELTSIFIGGGTPSLLSPESYARLLSAVRTMFNCPENMEITLEANPGTVDQARFSGYRAVGINRLSLGIQSFNPRHLKALGRIHDGQQAQLAIERARKAGFENINLDLMHGLPAQTIEEALDDLHTALAYAPTHLSWYQLTIEPNTEFYKQKPPLPSEDDAYAIEVQGLESLAKAGFERYEISAFCKNGQVSQHNLNYWRFGDYLGIGAGAHGKWTTPEKTMVRSRKHRQPNEYLAADKPFMAACDVVSSEECAFEFMLNTTRLEEIIPNTLFVERTGLSLDSIANTLQFAAAKGLLTINEHHWQITPLGRRFTNDLQLLFLPS